MLKIILQLLIFGLEGYRMTNRTMGVVKGIGTGLAAGAVIGFLGSYAMNNKKSLKKKTKRIAGTMTDMLDNMQYMFR